MCKPFTLIFAGSAPHQPAHAAPGEEHRYRDLAPPRPPSYNEADVSDKPDWRQWRPPLSPRRQVEIDRLRRRQLQTLWSLDEAISTILDVLANQGWLDHTAIFYISDNGLFWGEHRLMFAKGSVYEEAIRVPFALRYPPVMPTGRTVEELVANIDIAPTIYQLAGVPMPAELDGLSLLPLLQGTSVWRDEVLLEGWPRSDPYAGGGLRGVLKWATLLLTGKPTWAPYRRTYQALCLHRNRGGSFRVV
jgi:N-acetylglucosamine-6-sulfatase